uniref:RNA-directed DNA polymerase n=1 Tax=Trichogramma kaykai TaxID=54128 RepID=A0ABD2WXP2_9HYME
MSQIRQESRIDRKILLIRKGLYENIWDQSIQNYKIFQTELCFQDEILLRGNKIVIPENLRQQVLKAAHEGHPGIVAMKGRLRTKVWWSGIDKDAENIVKNCKGCTLVSAPDPPNPMKRRELPVAPWVDVSLDFMGPLPSKDYIFLVVDYYSRYKEIKIMRSTTTEDTIKVLKEIFSRLGFPSTITSDNGPQFKSDTFAEFCSQCGIVHLATIPYWPQMNGEVERQNRSVLKRLKISQIEKKDWKADLMDYLMMYNSTPQATTGKTPSELFYGRQFRDKLPTISDVGKNWTNDEEMRDRDKAQKEKGKLYGDRKRHATDKDLQVGEQVFVKNIFKTNKLTPNFDPVLHTVMDVNKGDVHVRNDTTGQECRRNIVHLKRVNGVWNTIKDAVEEEKQPVEKDSIKIQEN